MKMKNKSIKKTYITLAIIGLILGGCKAPSITQSEKIQLPETFANQTSDTATAAALSWKEFFPDPYLITYIDSALANNHSFLQTLEHVSIAREQLRIGKGSLLPEISLNLGTEIQRFGQYTMDGVGNFTTNTPDLEQEKHIPDPYKQFNLGLNFQWEANIWGKLNDKKRAAALRWMQSVEAKQLAQTILISEVAIQYYNLIGLDHKCVILKEEIEKTRESYKLTNELMKEGEVSRLSVDQFLSRGMNLKEKLLETEQAVRETEHALALLLGKLPFNIKRSTFDELSQYCFPTAFGIPAQLIQNRPDIKSAELALLASKADLSAARKTFFPSLILGGSGGFNAFNLSKWFVSPASLVYDLAAGISAPIFKRHEIQALWNESKARQRISLLNYHYTVLKSYQEVSDLIDASEQMKKRKTLKAEESKVHHRSIEHAKELFHTGFVGYLDVLSAAERYLDCELERINLNVSYCQVHTLLYRSIGGGQF